MTRLPTVGIHAAADVDLAVAVVGVVVGVGMDVEEIGMMKLIIKMEVEMKKKLSSHLNFWAVDV